MLTGVLKLSSWIAGVAAVSSALYYVSNSLRSTGMRLDSHSDIAATKSNEDAASKTYLEGRTTASAGKITRRYRTGGRSKF
jgi:hypothetical protein